MCVVNTSTSNICYKHVQSSRAENQNVFTVNRDVLYVPFELSTSCLPTGFRLSSKRGLVW